MNSRLLLISLFLQMFFVGNMVAQVTFSNQKLQDIHEQLTNFKSESQILSPSIANEQIISKLHKTRAVAFETNNEGMVTHIGFQLFDRAILDGNSDAHFFYFVERYLLELMLLDEQSIQFKMRQQRVRIKSEIYPLDLSVKECLTAVLSDPQLVTSVQISRNKNRYTVICYQDKNIYLAINFPANRELITAFTKLEAEQSLFDNFEHFLAHPQDAYIVQDEDVTPYKDGMYYAFDASFMNEEMLSTSFYQKVDGRYQAIFDEAYLVESVYNLFNAYYNDSTTIAKLTFSLYAGETNSYELPVCMLSKYLRKESCSLYTGIKKMGRNSIEASVMAVNQTLGYYHLLVFNMIPSILSHPQENRINVKMYCYIPMHNVSNLMGE